MKHILLRTIAGTGLLLFGLTSGALAQDRDQAKTFPVGRDEFRIARTKEELSELQSKLAAGRYDQPELDNVIAGLQRVVSDNRLSPRDRDMLNDDLNRMRDFRARHDAYGAR
jgi:hypothetical protein